MPSSKRSVNVRFDDDEFEAVRDLAIKYGISRSEFIRKAMVGQLQPLPTDTLDAEQFEQYITQLSVLRTQVGSVETQLVRIGNNVNQIAKKMNSGENVSAETLKRMGLEVEEIKQKIDRLVRSFLGEK